MELGKLSIIKLRTLSNYRKVTLVILLISLLITMPRLLKEKTSSLNKENTEFFGYVEKYEKTEEYTSFEIRLPSYKNEILKGIIYQNIDLEYHDYIKVVGTLEEITGYHNFNCFSYSKWANSKNMYYRIDAKNIEIIRKNQNIFYGLKNQIIKILDKNPSSNYLYALLLGDDSKIGEMAKKSYQENGISHLFALSGMHLSFLSSILVHLFKKIHLKEKFSYLFLFTILALYLFLASFPASLLRAYFFLVFKTINGKIYKDKSNIFAFVQAFSLLILMNPFYLLDIGFTYSFSISFAIIIARPKLKNISSKLLSSLLFSYLAF